MLKEERQKYLLDQLKKNGIVKVTEIVQELKVADMTIRRDLQELENKGLIIRIHGGAKLVDTTIPLVELSHREKKNIHLSEKIKIAKIIATNIEEGDTVFLGPGTTIELAYDFLTIEQAKIITNSIHVFNKFKNDARFEIILIGGAYRNKTGAFVGTIANDFISNIYVKKSFIGVNGLDTTTAFTSNEDEGLTQRYALNSAEIKYLVADHHKLDKKDFYGFYSLNEIDYLITDCAITDSQREKFEKYVKIMDH
ncbi:DeoR family transcriptional regulator [Enterococcus villorum]|uniref:Lactose phosphotransferase system repressor n=1 Tax=Enterococcus villorum TaxID=112904 RepID=A0A1V8Y9I6_9ENTE|nr:DeoR/GlpR family DNA-binding transcription regulator [Enterococcus villorum]OQO69284.1 DeoR family transcriptional regulator [Enterococcus villorum]OQO71947.1 DeoR family transcriptional regulator [Enterococcus villorum]